MTKEQLQSLVGQRQHELVMPSMPAKTRPEGSLLVPKSMLEYALKNGVQQKLATYCRLRHETYLNAGLVFQQNLKTTTERVHLKWLLSRGWVRRIKRGVYQMVSVKTIAQRLGKARTAASMTKEDWKDPIAACFAGWLTCYARGWKNTYSGAALADEVKRSHFVIASSEMLSGILDVSDRTIHLWKERAWNFYWQKESARYVMPSSDWTAGMRGGVDLGAMRLRAGYRVLLGPNVFYNFSLQTARMQW